MAWYEEHPYKYEDKYIMTSTKLVDEMVTEFDHDINFTQKEMLEILGLLNCIFPPEISVYILRLARVRWRMKETTRQLLKSKTMYNQRYLELPIPKFDGFIPQDITVILHSHDQGWSSTPQFHGTKQNSNSWAELSIGKPDSKREKIFVNLHARRAWQTHKITFKSSHPLYESLKEGDIVTLYLRSDSPGWAIHARYASIVIYFSF